MALIDALFNTISHLAIKAQKGMQSLLLQKLAQPVDRGGIFSKCGLDVVRKGNAIIEVTTNFPDYAYFTRYGRRAGKMPPEKPIADWVRKHNISEAAIFPIRRKIGREGTKGADFTTPLFRMVEMIKKTVTLEAAVSVQKNIIGEFRDLSSMEVQI